VASAPAPQQEALPDDVLQVVEPRLAGLEARPAQISRRIHCLKGTGGHDEQAAGTPAVAWLSADSCSHAAGGEGRGEPRALLPDAHETEARLASLIDRANSILARNTAETGTDKAPASYGLEELGGRSRASLNTLHWLVAQNGATSAAPVSDRAIPAAAGTADSQQDGAHEPFPQSDDRPGHHFVCPTAELARHMKELAELADESAGAL
jgi:hypothetical protein